MDLEPDDHKRAALVELLTTAIERDRFPLSPRIKPLRGILAKLGVGSAPAMPDAAPKVSQRPTGAVGTPRVYPGVRSWPRERPEAATNEAFRAAGVNRRVGWRTAVPDLPGPRCTGSEAAIDCLKPNIRRCIDFRAPLVTREVAG
jgi:hypothetical protein